MYLHSYRVVVAAESFAFLYISLEEDPEFEFNEPIWPENSDIHTVKIAGLDWLVEEDDRLVVVAVSGATSEEFSILDDISALSNAPIKLLLCNDPEPYEQIEGYRSVIVTENKLGISINHLAWSLIAGIYDGMMGIDMADIETLVATSRNAKMATFSCDFTLDSWEEMVDFSTEYWLEESSKQSIVGILSALSLHPESNMMEVISLYADRFKDQLSGEAVKLMSLTFEDPSSKYRPVSITEIIMLASKDN
jgi:hypothetical protein